MRTLIVLTDAYYKELDECTATYVRRAKRPAEGYIRIYYEKFDAEGFYPMLEGIALKRNHALRGFAKLTNMVKNATPQTVTNKNIAALREYVESNRAMHLEGYVAFRMAGYNAYINCLLYAIAKKLKVN
ncbi:MAG: hypothetical protein LBL96_12125 [Clostridiales bacterium]|jgi:hypothetical protein|nr:hypothetical protein [Clostridiales bacterium]